MTDTTDAADLLAGRFWRPNNEENVARGRLTFAHGARPHLELDDPLTPLLKELESPGQSQGVRVFGFADQGPELTLFTVHGVLDGGTRVTLVDAFERKRKVGQAADRQWLEAQFAVVGDHVEGRDHLYTGVRLRLQHLDGWAALPGFVLEHLAEDGRDRLTLGFDPASAAPVPLKGGGELSLEQTPEVEFSPLHGGRIGRAVWLRATGLPPATIDDLERRIVMPLSTLLTLATDTACPPVAVDVTVGPDQPWLTLRHSGLEPPTKEVRTPDRQLLPLPTLGLERVAEWLGVVEQLGPLPPVVAAAVGAPRGTLETQLLNLTTVAEGLHRALFPDARRLTDEQAKRTREAVRAGLTDLEQEARDAVEGAIQHRRTPPIHSHSAAGLECSKAPRCRESLNQTRRSSVREWRRWYGGLSAVTLRPPSDYLA